MENIEKQAEQFWENTEQYKEYNEKNKYAQELKEAGDGTAEFTHKSINIYCKR